MNRWTIAAALAVALTTALPGCGGTHAAPDAAGTVDVAPPSQCDHQATGRVALPADDAAHPAQPVEWWYWTGHLETADHQWFGFEQAFFSVTVLGQKGQMIHHAISDLGGGSFHFTEAQLVGAPTQVDGGFDLAIGAMTAAGGGGHDALHGEVDGYVLDVNLAADKPAVLQHGDGYTDYSFGGNTYYYSRERMSATGTIAVGGAAAVPVSGTAWFDHQYGDLNTAVNTGWDWFAIQLDDQREIMLFIVRTEGQATFVGGSLNDASCVATEIAADDFEVTATGSWMRDSTCTYPSGWNVRVGDLHLTVTPVMEDQELQTPTIKYWEGAATVSGDATGRAYVELTGYCQ